MIYSKIYNKIIFNLAECDINEDELDDIDGIKKEGNACIKQEKDASATSSTDKKDGQNSTLKLDPKEVQRAKELKINESELVRDLKTQLK